VAKQYDRRERRKTVDGVGKRVLLETLRLVKPILNYLFY
jgi:hypothetical protein